MRHIVFEADNYSLNESLCDGIAKRIFRIIAEHAANGANCDILDESSASGLIVLKNAIDVIKQYAQKATLPKKTIIDALIVQFLSIASSSSSDYAIKIGGGKLPTYVSGVIVDNRLIYGVKLKIDVRKPHRTEVCSSYIGFTRHALSRMIRRSKPDDVIFLIALASDLCRYVIESARDIDLFKDNDGLYWIPVPTFGYFLLAKDSSCEGFIVVTFVESGMLRDEQLVTSANIESLFHENVPDWDRFKTSYKSMLDGIINKPKMTISIIT